ncbi:MAG: enterochelin esterase, partial [Gammaproteobacteria bacterium]|nr:enterochelin esterase [Gammaproteobacteria bacterium]
KDQYNLVFGARQLTKKLQLLGIDHRYEEFPDNHSTIDYRRDISLPFLYEAIR